MRLDVTSPSNATGFIFHLALLHKNRYLRSGASRAYCSDKTIKKFKPRLAISVYHGVDDLIAIPKQIHSIDPPYQLFLDHHTIHTEASFIYAVVR